MRPTPATLLLLLALASCASPPGPPGVDASRRRPANAAADVELQRCASELHNTRIAVGEQQRLAATAMASAARLAQAAGASSRNAVYVLLFAHGDTTAQVAEGELARLVEDARAAPLIVLRGRTDGIVASAVEERVARRRAESVEALLVQAGIAPARIRTTWQPAGDHAADNGLPGGRALNWRVEVEIYRTAPQAPVVLVTAGSPASDLRSVPSNRSEVQHEQTH